MFNAGISLPNPDKQDKCVNEAFSAQKAQKPLKDLPPLNDAYQHHYNGNDEQNMY
jgi:hypothetical protein